MIRSYFLLLAITLTTTITPAFSNPPEPFYCNGLAGNFPGDVLYHGKWNRVTYFSWYQYPPANSLSGPNQACGDYVNRLNSAISDQGLCLCEEETTLAAELNQWTAGSSSFEEIQHFPRVEAPGEIPPYEPGKAFGLCQKALEQAQESGACPKLQ